MANYYGSGRTNYFLVKDAEEFKKDIDALGVGFEVVSRTNANGIVHVALLSEDENGFPADTYNEETEDYETISWEEIFGKHLADGSVAIIIEVGSEKLRYLNGYAVAYNNKGESKSIGLEEIYDLAKELGSEITRAEY
jgi:hypothetical protein